MAIGVAFRDTLPAHHQQALQDACSLLIDTYLDDLHRTGERAWHFTDMFICEFLPRRYLPQYSAQFARQFFMCLMTVTWKLNQDRFIPFACVAEELAAWTLIQEAVGMLETHGKMADFDGLVDAAFEDTDYLMLYDDAYEGSDESAVAPVMGITPLSLDAWFTPFHPESAWGAPHPYLEKGAHEKGAHEDRTEGEREDDEKSDDGDGEEIRPR